MRNIFVSYAHRLDQEAADNFREIFGVERNAFSDRSLSNQDLSSLTDETIKNTYIRPKIRNSSVTIILIGSRTGGRWWIDWEIYYSLLKTGNNERNGLLGIKIPYKEHWIPNRLSKNLHMGKIIEWPSNYRTLVNEIEEAYNCRWNSPNLKDPLRQRNS